MNKVLAFFKSLEGKVITESPSPPGNWLEAVLVSVEEGKITAELTVRKDMTNPAGMLHGGVISLIADEMIGACIACLDLPDYYPSINLNTDYLLPVKEGEKIRTTSEIIRKGKNIIHSECRLFNSEQKLVAKATANNIRISNAS
jgi:uncharacterized protein (TIGR00369 family)